jgi:hypothetical protein
VEIDMKIEVDVKFNIGDRVIVKKTSGNSNYIPKMPVEAVISGYSISKDSKRTTVYYFIEPIRDNMGSLNLCVLKNAASHKRRYPAKWLEKIEE